MAEKIILLKPILTLKSAADLLLDLGTLTPPLELDYGICFNHKLDTKDHILRLFGLRQLSKSDVHRFNISLAVCDELAIRSLLAMLEAYYLPLGDRRGLVLCCRNFTF